MTDDEIIDAFHRAIRDHEAAKAGRGNDMETYEACVRAEQAINARFGPGEGWKRYRAKYPKPTG